MNFPKWAPKELCDYYREKDDFIKGEKELLERLLTNPTMKPVWEAFRKMHDQYYQKERKELLELFFSNRSMKPVWEVFKKINDECYQEDADRGGLSWVCIEYTLILGTYLESCREHLTSARLIENFEEIAEGAKRLARATKNVHIHLEPFRIDWAELSQALADRFPPSDPRHRQTLDLMGSKIEAGSPFSLEVSPYHEILEILQSEAEVRVKLLKGSLQDKCVNDMPICEFFRLISIIPLIGAPNAEKARANYFIRYNALFFQHKFGSFRYRLLARLASVVLDDPDIDESTVKSSLKQFSKSSGTKIRKEIMRSRFFSRGTK